MRRPNAGSGSEYDGDRRNRIIGLNKDLDPDDMCNDRTADYLGVSDGTGTLP